MTDTTREAVARAMTFEQASELARKAIYDDGRGMIGRNRNHLQDRVARAILAAAALRPAQDAEGWRDIASAPRNHFPVLVWSEAYGRTVAFLDVTWTWWPCPASHPLPSAPTHWMPLPASPPRTLEGK